MTAHVYPSQPSFGDESERAAWEALRTGLRDEDVLLCGVRFTDPEYGEVEIDLLVLLPDCGAAVIEVKGGKVSFADGVFRQSGASSTQEIDPIGQARRGVYALRRFLENQPTWSRGAVRAAWLVCFPYTEVTGSMGPEGRRDVVVGASDLEGFAGLVYDRLWDQSLQVRLPAAGWVEAALGHLLGTWDEPAELAARTVARLQHVDQLTQAQASVLDFARNVTRLEVTGSAGTGKTWLAMEQARRWSDDSERVCFVSYGRGVAASVSRAMADLPGRSQPAFIGTFHQLGWTWGVEAGPDVGSEYWESEAPRLMLAAAHELSDEQRFTAFVVDEAQDFADSWWPALLASAAGPDFRLAVFRDDEQAVFHERKGRPDLPLTPFVLDENLRNPVQVVNTFQPLISAKVRSGGGDGFPVEFVDPGASDVVAAADAAVASLLEERGWLPEHVALLTTQHRHPVHQEFGSDKASYWDSLWDNDLVFYSTVAGFKGLERPVIVLAVDGFHDGVDPRSVLYAGMSRARDLLVVVGRPTDIEPIIGEKLMRRLRRGEISLPMDD